MNKSEKREAQKIRTMHQLGMIDTAARSLSALHRAALRLQSKFEMMQLAIELDLLMHEEFII